METNKIRIELEYLQGPIWYSDAQTGIPMTGIDIIDNDEILCKYNVLCSDMYLSYFEFNSHGQACWFNEEQEKKDKNKMLEYITIIINRLDELNDGSYIVDDRETERLKNL